MRWSRQRLPNLEIKRLFNSMKYILILLTLSTISLQAFDSLIDHEKLNATEILLEKEPAQKTVFEKKVSHKVQKNEVSINDTTLLSPFTSPLKLKKILNHQNTIILDVDDINIYKKGHIIGAIHVDVSSYITKEQNPYKLMKPESSIKNKIIDLGINKDSKVVIYSHNTKKGILNSSYLAFVLITFGFENVSILDGGYMAWVFENERLVSSKRSKSKDDGNFLPQKNHNVIASQKYILDNLSNITMLDAREAKYYYGTHKSKKIKEFGHISGAKSSYYGDKFLIDSTLRKKNELNDIYYKGHKLKQNDNIVVYADNVFKASMEWYVLYKVMRFQNTKIYEASLLEYFNEKNNPKSRFIWE